VSSLTRSAIALPLVLASTGVVLVAGPPAHAAAGPSLTKAGGVVTITAGTAPLDLYVAESSDNPGSITFGSSPGWGSVTGCVFLYGGTSYADCAGVTSIVVNGGGGDDYLGVVEDVLVPVEAHGGEGDDELFTGGGADRVYGDGGADSVSGDVGNDIVDGGAGNDWFVDGDGGKDTVTGGSGDDRVFGGDGNDNVSGGTGRDEVFGDTTSWWDEESGADTVNGDAGDDQLFPGPGNDVVNGGADDDTADYDGFQEDGVAFRASLDQVANDGPVGDLDNIGPLGDVENLTSPDYTGVGSVTLTGDDGPNALTVKGSDGDVEVDGLGGDDTILTHFIFGEDAHVDGGAGDDEIVDYAEADRTTILGGDGDDTIDGRYGNETIDGGPGSDEITAGFGNDVVDGGPGVDSIQGEDGNDIIEAADGTLDSVSCGKDADIARVDANDVVAIDVVNLCESLTKVQPPKPQVAVPTTKVYRLNPRGVATFRLTNRSDFTVNVAATARTTKKVGSGSTRLAADAAGRLGLKLTRAALATVRKKGSIRATVTFVLRGNGQTAAVKRTVKLVKR